MLISTQKDVQPLEIILDDAELSDLTKCFDQFINDSRIAIDWKLPNYKPFSRNQVGTKLVKIRRFVSLFAGAIMFVSVAALLYFVDNKQKERDSTGVSNDTLVEESLDK